MSDKHYEGRYLYDSGKEPKVIREWGMVEPARDNEARKLRIDSESLLYDTRDIISWITSEQK